MLSSVSFIFFQETNKSTDLQTALQLSIKAIQHENVDVRIHAFTSLKETLYKNQVPCFVFTKVILSNFTKKKYIFLMRDSANITFSLMFYSRMYTSVSGSLESHHCAVFSISSTRPTLTRFIRFIKRFGLPICYTHRL